MVKHAPYYSAEQKARALGHLLGPWDHRGSSLSFATCRTCGREVTILRSDSSIGGKASVERCSVSGEAGREAA